MLLLLILSVTVSVFSACVADTTAKPVYCGEIPRTIYSCLGNPKIVHGFSHNCEQSVTECGLMTCYFRNAGWLNDGKVDKQKVISHFDEFATRSPEWAAAVQHAKAACLSFDLPAQGAHLNCPAFDIMLCTLRSFIQTAQPSQWSSEPRCEYPKQFTAACPLCPTDCFVPQIPYGTCNACVGLPRSP